MENTCYSCLYMKRTKNEDPCNLCVGFGRWRKQEASPLEGRKDDTSKPRYDLYPPEALDGTVQVLTVGAAKYSDRNWEKGMAWGRVFAAAMRHLWAWWRGEVADPETGLSHLHHAACCIAFLQTYEARGTGKDDRPSSMGEN